MDNIERLTPELILAAYRRHPLYRPACGSYHSGDRVCPAVMVAMDRGAYISAGTANPCRVISRATGLPRDYVLGFTKGIDFPGGKVAEWQILADDIAEFARGFADGQAAYRPVFRPGEGQ